MPMRPRRRVRARTTNVLLVCAFMALGGACAQAESAGPARSDDAESSAGEVLVEGLAFDPEELTVATGTTVSWTNQDSVEHTVTSGDIGEQGVPGVSKGKPDRPDGVFDGDLDGVDETFSFTFDEPGTYAYFCRIHGGMTGVVVVE